MLIRDIFFVIKKVIDKNNKKIIGVLILKLFDSKILVINIDKKENRGTNIAYPPYLKDGEDKKNQKKVGNKKINKTL